MLQPPCWDSAPSHMQDRPWLGWSHSLISAFPYSCIQMSLMIQTLGTWHVLFPGKPIVCWYLKYHSLLLPGSCRKQRQPGVVSTICLLIRGSWSESAITTCTASSVLWLAHGSEPPWTPAGLCSCWLDAEPTTAYSLDTNCTGLTSVPQNLSPPETCERTLIWKLGLLQK